MKYSTFEDIPVWQDARYFVAKIYKITKTKFGKDFELINQLRSAALSIPLNIAEGFERKTNKEFARFVNVSKASAGECRAILYVALDLNYLSQLEFDELKKNILDISRQLSKFEQYLLDTNKK